MTDQSAQAILWLTEKKGLSVNQIARQMNMTPGGVRNALTRAQSASAPRASRVSPAVQSPRNITGLEVVSRDPCVGCGVRADHHAEFGCKRWRTGL